ncbi:hypothetical protein ACJ5NV_07920 [Loktanella agnita]|uniref:hypothetical protein n=1 Tax=Loktanella agnita TaxID=287097 RepID=UPI0039879C0F
MGYNIMLGKVTNDAFDGYAANIGLDTDFISPAPTTGTVTYRTYYHVFEMTDMTERPDNFGFYSDDDNPFVANGRIDITADFDDGEVTGTSELLNVEAMLNGHDFVGTATWRGVDAELRGGVGRDSDGSNTLIGGFHASTPETVFAGGMSGKEQQP